MALPKEEKERILRALSERVAGVTCPICHQQRFVMGDGYIFNHLQENFLVMNLGGPAIPTIPVVCHNCGFVAHFSLGVLGMLPRQEPGRATT